jgi:hypothetical protein
MSHDKRQKWKCEKQQKEKKREKWRGKKGANHKDLVESWSDSRIGRLTLSGHPAWELCHSDLEKIAAWWVDFIGRAARAVW